MQLTVFSDDWGRHPSSCQHLVRQLLDRHSVRWVNTIGTRRPSVDYYSIKRGLEKLGGWLAGNHSSTGRSNANPVVMAPFMLPSFGSSLSRRINASLLTRSLTQTMSSGLESVAITTLPIAADLVGRLPVSRWVYYCVDDLSEWPGLDKSVLERMERELLDKVDAVVAVSENLSKRLHSLGRESTLLTHGVDMELWSRPVNPSVSILSRLEAPYLVFWGVVDQRLDFECIQCLSRMLTAGSIILAGPENNPDPRLHKLANVHLTGPIDYEQLPGLAAAASVLIMPYRDSAVTRAMQPLKLMEYLSTGKPVVCADLPAVQPWRGACHTYESTEEFAAVAISNLDATIPVAQALCRAQLQGHSWATKAEEFERVLLGHGQQRQP